MNQKRNAGGLRKNGGSEDYLEICKSMIESHLEWGNSEDWTNQDFHLLSEKIYDKTNIILSVTTLKRVWGKIKYEGHQQATTLNTLARFNGYNNWASFKAEYTRSRSNGIKLKRLRNFSGKNAFIVSASAVIVIVIAFVLYFSSDSDHDGAYSDGEFSFEGNVVSEGLPNSVVFNYDVASLASSNFLIQQNWDTTKRFGILKDKNEATSIYYYPGHWRAKLIADNKILKEQNIFIKTNGWLATIAKNDVPIYFNQDELIADGSLKIDRERLKALGLNSFPVKWFTYHLIQDFGGLDGDNFILEAAVQNTETPGVASCKKLEIILIGEKAVMKIPKSIKGCMSELKLKLSDVALNGKTADLSAFTSDSNGYDHFSVSVKNKQVTIALNGVEIFHKAYSKSLGAFKGIRFKFLGNGEVDYVRLNDQKGNSIINDDFDR